MRFLNAASRGVVHALSGALPEEADEPSILEKPRIAFSYSKKSAGRLNDLILETNHLGAAATNQSRE